MFTGNGTDVTAEARRSVENGARMVVGGGGDGTLSAIATVLAGTETPLGILPLGTLNHFAKDLGIPLDIDAAVATLATGRITQVDVGEVNGSLFLNNSGLGLYPVIVHSGELRQSHGIAKWPAALWATCKAFCPIRATEHSGPGGRTGAPAPHAGRVRGKQRVPRSGEFSCRRETGSMTGYSRSTSPTPTGRFRLIWFSIRALFGKPKSDGEFDAFLTSEFWIETRHHALKVSLDGEVTALRPPLHYRTRPLSLRVMVPSQAGPDMRTIVHLSDLHFGRLLPETVEPCLAAVKWNSAPTWWSSRVI